MTSSHTPTPKPSFFLALIALGIVLRFRPAWVAVNLGDVAESEGQSAERISRLISRVIEPFELLLAGLTRRGRPPRSADQDSLERELGLMGELLGVTKALLECVPLKGDRIRALIVGAWQRLSQSAGMTQERFCEALGLPARTLRAWLKRPPQKRITPPAPQGEKKRKRQPRRRRFDFDVTLPDTQIAGDTTDVSAFGIGLKVIAAQDVGGRDCDLFDAIVVDDSESAAHVIDVFTKAVGQSAGAQVITDQGTPYMAKAVSDAFDAMSAEHAPQREGDPFGKSTIERAFHTLKSIAAPILGLTDRLADALPQLRNQELAASVTRLFFAAILRAYQHGARAARTAIRLRGTIDEAELARLAEESRERARAIERSARLFLQHVHEIYAFPGHTRKFVDSLRRYPIAVLRDAERALRDQMHRDDIRDKRTYFAAIVRRLNEQHVDRSRREERERIEAQKDAAEERARKARAEAWSKDPVAHLHAALDAVASQWEPESHSLFADGEGMGLGWIRCALRQLWHLYGSTALDIAAGVLYAFRIGHLDRIGPEGVAAIEALFDREICSTLSFATAPCAASNPSTILSSTGLNRRRPTCDRLRI